ncbi:hypothetical protein [Ignavibacterium sp.]|uniref:hypothetical protein n=1 Tax=Ignavibacterium sp. TaxID=2651167 RepID=UPI00307F57B9
MKTRIFILAIIIFSNINYPQNFQWIKIGNGVQYTLTENKIGNNILVAIGGWQAKQQWVNKWSEEMFKAKLNELGIQHIFSVKGPDEVCNKNKEINIKALADYIKNIIYATYYVDKVILVAHSSGSFVANDLLNLLYGKSGIAKDSFYVNKVHYFNLDGGIGGSGCGEKLEDEAINYIVKIYGVAAYDSVSGKYSSNYETMRELSEKYGDKSELIVVDATNSGCNDKWCLHDALIISKPHNPDKYDLEKDYTLFDDERRVQTAYFNQLIKK